MRVLGSLRPRKLFSLLEGDIEKKVLEFDFLAGETECYREDFKWASIPTTNAYVCGLHGDLSIS